MPTTDQQIDAARHRLGSLINHSYLHMIAAMSLLEHRAIKLPNSAEAKAYSLLAEGRAEIERWIRNSSDLLNVQVTRAELTSPEPAVRTASLDSMGEAL